MKKEMKQALIFTALFVGGIAAWIFAADKLKSPTLGGIYSQDAYLESIIYAAKAHEINSGQPLEETTLAELINDEFQQGVSLLLPGDIYREATRCDDLSAITIRRNHDQEGITINIDPSHCDVGADKEAPLLDKSTASLTTDHRKIIINTGMPAKSSTKKDNKGAQ